MTDTMQRVLGVVVLLICGGLSLPVVAYFFDSDAEDWIIPIQLVLMAVVGMVVTISLPALARDRAAIAPRAMTGALWGILAALAGLMVYGALLHGFGGS